MKNTRQKNKKLKQNKTKKIEKLSPFELKNTLERIAKKSGKEFLDAGRGNPNFFNDFVRESFIVLQEKCIKLSKKLIKGSDICLYPLYDEKINYYDKLKRSINKNKTKKEINEYLLKYLKSYKNEKFNEKMYDIIISCLGTIYPTPPRIQMHLEEKANKYMLNLIHGKSSENVKEEYEYFATEGAASGIMYVFNSLIFNKLLNKGDRIAIITPIFSPYLEMPKLTNYGLKIIELKGHPNKEYSLSDNEINKLKDKRIKALFMVNPSNPGEYSLPKSNIMKISEIVNKERNDLIVVSDSVYAPFVKEYNSFMLSCPKNTIEIFSLSKYFGVTGMRLGLVMINKKNNINKLFNKVGVKEKNIINKNYSIITERPEKLTLMERILADSRQIAEAHVAGLSGPQQAIMSLFLYYDEYDRKYNNNKYKNDIRTLLIKRIKNVYSKLNYDVVIDDKSTNYYTIINIPEITKKLFGEESKKKLLKKSYINFIINLARKYGVVLLPGKGFGDIKWSVRVSLANLNTNDYIKISEAIKENIKDFC